MKLRLLIFVSLFIPILFFLTPWLGSILYRPELRGLPGDWIEHEFEAYADDASLLRGTVGNPENGTPRGLVLLLASSNLDRDWTHGGNGFPVGRILARRLAARGYQTLRFDQRGTGKTRQSGRNYAAPKNQARDASRVLEHLEKTGTPGAAPSTIATLTNTAALPFYIVAHGDGCAVALGLANNARRPVEGVLFTGCSLSGNLLDQWLERILSNMQRVGVDGRIREHARARIDVWRGARLWDAATQDPADSAGDAEATSPSDFDQHPDIQALDRALDQMLGERLIDFTRQADRFDASAELEALLSGSNTRVLHILGELDQVTPQTEIATERETAASRESRYGDRYRFRLLANTDHFLGEREARTAGSLFILLENLSPFRRISPAFLTEFDRAFGEETTRVSP